MRVAVVGSRKLMVPNLGDYLPEGVTEIITGGTRGVDTCAVQYAREHGIPCRVIRPDLGRRFPGASHRRQEAIIREAEMVLAFWDGASSGTEYIIRRCREKGVRCRVIRG